MRRRKCSLNSFEACTKSSKLLHIVSFVALLLPLSAQGQLLKRGGAKAGISSSGAVVKFASDYQPWETTRRLGMNGALFLESGGFSFFSLFIQAEYTQRGFVQKIDEVFDISDGRTIGLPANLRVRLDYISVPIMLKLRYRDLPSAPYIFLGPSANFLVHRASKYKFASGNVYNSSFRDQFNERSLSGIVGIGIAIGKFQHMTLLIEARYDFDLIDGMAATQLQAKNNTVALWFGISSM